MNSAGEARNGMFIDTILTLSLVYCLSCTLHGGHSDFLRGDTLAALSSLVVSNQAASIEENAAIIPHRNKWRWEIRAGHSGYDDQELLNM